MEECLSRMKQRLDSMARLPELFLDTSPKLQKLKQRWDLMSLRQEGSVAEFNHVFDSLSTNLDIPEDYLVDAYVSGLKQEIQESIRLFKPRTMSEARSMARAEEIYLKWRAEKTRKALENEELKKIETQEHLANAEVSLEDHEIFEPTVLTQETRIITRTSGLSLLEHSQNVPSATYEGRDAKILDVQGQTFSHATQKIKDVEKSANEVGIASGFRTPDTRKGGVSPTSYSVSSPSACRVSVLTRNIEEMPFSGFPSDFRNLEKWDNEKISSCINGSLIFDFSGSLQANFYHTDRCEALKETSHDSGSQLILCKGIFFLIYSLSSTVLPAANTESQLACIFSKCQNYFEYPFGLMISDGHMDFIFLELGPKLLQSQIIPNGLSRAYSNWVFVHISATRSVVHSWFKGRLIKMLQGSGVSQGSVFIDPMLFGLQLPFVSASNSDIRLASSRFWT